MLQRYMAHRRSNRSRIFEHAQPLVKKSECENVFCALGVREASKTSTLSLPLAGERSANRPRGDLRRQLEICQGVSRFRLPPPERGKIEVGLAGRSRSALEERRASGRFASYAGGGRNMTSYLAESAITSGGFCSFML